MTKLDLAKMMADFEQKGGTVKQLAAGERAPVETIPGLRYCRCGCHGDYTDHSMRAGESGRCSTLIVD